MAGAVLLHAGIIAATFFTWSHTLDIADQSPPIVPVDLVTIGEKTDIAPMVKEQPKDEPKDDTQPPAPEPVKTQEAQPPPDEAPPPPDEATSEPKITAPPPPIVPKLKPKPEQKKDKFDINNIVALLDKRAPSASAANAKVGNRTIRGIGAQNAMTMDLVDALRNQIAQCWSPPVGAPHPDQLIVSFELYLNPDGSVAQPPQLAGSSVAAASGDPFMRAAAEAARRAIYTCAPYRLPADRYNQWRDITLNFDPRQMVGQ